MKPDTLLAGIPQILREELLKTFREISRNYIEQRWEPAELNGGKFAEAAFAIISGAVSGTYPTQVNKPPDFIGACRALESKPADIGRPGDRSLRVLIPRHLIALYEMRNNRGVGHLGGDVDPNPMDATAVFSTASWVLAEFIRIFHCASTHEAQAVVNALAERVLPVVWLVPGGQIQRVLNPSLSVADQTLLLLHANRDWVDEDKLFESVEYNRRDNYRSKVLRPLHTKRLLEFDASRKRVLATPLGTKRAETILLKIKLLGN